ncbi:MAG: serine hydrolase domain-containing protein [Gemmatimonadales bacterium]|nr:serine hydrolase domain-containing protein [Gemmatimonadales bacterium]
MLAVAALTAMVAASQDTSGRWLPLTRGLEEAVQRRAFPGAVVAVGRRDTVLYLRAFGHLDYEHRAPVTTRTVYDLASLTKVVGLTTAIMMLVENGRVDLDAPVRGYVQLFGYTHDSTITVRHLLTHSSGLPAWKPYFQQAGTRGDIFDRAAHEPIENPTGTRMVYSDVGAIILTNMVETMTGERLDRYVQRLLFQPLGMRHMRYRPPPSWLPRIAPTEMDTTYRHRLVHGVVHDENAYAMGGVSGHAGLFGTAPDLVRFAQMMLRGGTFPSSRASSRALVMGAHGPGFAGAASERDVEIGFVRAETIAAFTRRQDSAFSSRALGWDTPDGLNSAGTRLGPHAFGHTGFTGTSIWMDPDQDLFVILLTNRVHPTRENTQIFEVRRRVADLAAVEIGGRR